MCTSFPPQVTSIHVYIIPPTSYIYTSFPPQATSLHVYIIPPQVTSVHVYIIPHTSYICTCVHHSTHNLHLYIIPPTSYVCTCVNHSPNKLHQCMCTSFLPQVASVHVYIIPYARQKPTLELEAFFKRHYNTVRFLQGTVMELKDLHSAKVSGRSQLVARDQDLRTPIINIQETPSQDFFSVNKHNHIHVYYLVQVFCLIMYWRCLLRIATCILHRSVT